MGDGGVERLFLAFAVSGTATGTVVGTLARPIAGTVAGAMVGTVARTIIGGAIVCGGVNQFVVQKPLLQIGGLHTDLDRVTQSEDLAGAAATDEVVLLVELEEVGLHICLLYTSDAADEL